ncbi:MAG: sensor histidine kinase, partial [Myxococcales bacterium]
KEAEELRARMTRYATMRAEVGAALARRGNLRETLQGCTQSMVDHLGAAFARIWTVNKNRQMLELQASAGMYTHLDGAHARVPVGALKIGLIARESRPYLSNDVAHDPRVGDPAWAEREGLVSFAGYPLVARGEVVGVVAMFARAPLHEDMLGALDSIADTIAQGIQRTRVEQALEDRARELARSNEELERFAYVASHDLQEPLRMVASYTQLLGRRYKGKLDSDADDFINYAVEGATRMQQLINDLLAYSRVGRGAGFTAVRMEEVLARTLGNLRTALTDSGAQVTHDPLPQIAADGTQMGQLLQNLLANAVKFRRPDEPPRIHVSAQPHEAGW